MNTPHTESSEHSLPLFPEAAPGAALAVWREIEAALPPPSEPRGDALLALREAPIPLKEEPRWPGEQAPPGILDALATDIYRAADESGFPNSVSSDGARRFDALAKGILKQLDIQPTQAMSGQGGMFRYFSMQLVQAVGPWRFPDAFDSTRDTSARRLRNPYQDIIGRLWWQSYFFDDREVSQDLIETVLGRPGSLGRDARIARAFVDVIMELSINDEAIRRATAKDVTVAAAWLSAVDLDDKSLTNLFKMLADRSNPVPDIIEWSTATRDSDAEPVKRIAKLDQELVVRDPKAAGTAIKSFRARRPANLQIGVLASTLDVKLELLTEIENGTCGPAAMAHVIRKLMALGCDFGDSVTIDRTDSSAPE